MLEEQGTVLALDKQTVWVSVTRMSSCQSCESKAGCAQGSFAKRSEKKTCVIRIPNGIDLRVGDEVIIGLDERVVLKSALLVYMAPLLLMLLGAGLGQWWNGASDGFAAVGAFSGLGLGFLLVYRHGRRHQDDERFHPVILSVPGKEFGASKSGTG